MRSFAHICHTDLGARGPQPLVPRPHPAALNHDWEIDDATHGANVVVFPLVIGLRSATGAEVWPGCDLAATENSQAAMVTSWGLACALVAAIALGYWFGHRAATAKPTWRSRTQPSALARQAVTLAALVATRRVERSIIRKLAGLRRRRAATSPLASMRGLLRI